MDGCLLRPVLPCSLPSLRPIDSEGTFTRWAEGVIKKKLGGGKEKGTVKSIFFPLGHVTPDLKWWKKERCGRCRQQRKFNECNFAEKIESKNSRGSQRWRPRDTCWPPSFKVASFHSPARVVRLTRVVAGTVHCFRLCQSLLQHLCVRSGWFVLQREWRQIWTFALACVG